MPFAIIISEKGGAERRELFDKSEVSVGRVQGNDLMLPKGNVSKRHARLMFRDGRFIVADMKSTNGTYVNGRKIAQATIVREGDKIYVGDFVLRFEATAGTQLAPESAPNAPGPRDATASELGHASSPSSPSSPAGAGQSQAGPAPREPGQVSHYPLENDPDESANASPRVQVPSPPRVPSGLSRGPGGTQFLNQHAATAQSAVQATTPKEPANTSVPAAPAQPVITSAQRSPQIVTPVVQVPQSITQQPTAVPVAASSVSRAPAPPAISHAPAAPAISHAPAPAAVSHSPAPPASSPMIRDATAKSLRESPAQAAHRLALATLVDRIGEMIDLEPLRSGVQADEALANRLERAIRDQVVSLKEDGEIPSDIDQDALGRDAHRELLALGPLGPLLDDDEVTDIHASRHDHLTIVRAGQTVSIEPAFSSEESLLRVIARLCQQSGHPLVAGEVVVERRVARGGRLLAMLSPLSINGHVLAIRKRRRGEPASEDLVRSGAVGRGMWTFLSHVMAGRLNVLVVAPHGVPVTSLVGALMSATSPEDRVVAAQDPEDVVYAHAHAASIAIEDTTTGEPIMRAIGRLAWDRLVCGAFAGAVAAATLDLISDGRHGVVAILRAPSLRQGLGRAIPELCAVRQGLSPDAAREWMASSFDLAIEVARLRDGRLRVVRITELGGVEQGAIALRDVFHFNVERAAAGGAVEGSFSPTGSIPRFVDELRLRGISIDASVFDRQSVR